MGKLLEGVKLTTLNRLTWIFRLLCFILVASSWLLFGTSWSLLLSSLFVLSYSTASFLCYHPEARPWRERLDSWYEFLFIWTLNYKHTTTNKMKSDTGNSTSESQPREHSTQHTHTRKRSQPSAPSVPCHKEAQKMIQLVMRDFINKWYGDVTTDDEFPEDVQKILEHVALEINIRMQQIDLEEVVTEIATLVVPYLEAVNEAGTRDFNGVNVFDVNHEKCQREFESNSAVAHRALQTSEHEIRYYRQALDAVILCACPVEYRNCDVARMFVREILLQNIIEPVLTLLCDTDFLYDAIPMILSKATVEKVERELAIIQHENEELEKRLSHGKLVVKIRDSLRQQNRRFHMNSTTFDQSEPLAKSPSPVHSPQTSRTITRSRSMASVSTSTAPTGSRSPLRRQSEVVSLSPEHTLPPSSTPHYLTRSLPPEMIGVEAVRETDHFEQVDSDLVYVQLAPIYIERSVRVVSGASSHTAYIFKFPTSLLGSEELKELGVLESDTHLEGMRRYSHFEKLHNALLKSPLSLYVKGLDIPDKRGLSSLVSKLPFTNSEPDPTLILERRQGLEKYLQSISSVGMIVRSEPFRKFLKDGVKALKEANIVNPQKSAKRKSFLGIVKPTSLATLGEDTLKAEPIPKRPFEEVVSAYLNTHLPLPCHSFHSLYSTHHRKPRVNRTSTTASHRESVVASTTYLPPSISPTVQQLQQKTSPSQSLTSTSSLGHERDLSKVESVADLCASTDDSEAAMEAIYDTGSTPENNSPQVLVPPHPSLPYDEEEGQTTGMSFPTQSVSPETHTGHVSMSSMTASTSLQASDLALRTEVTSTGPYNPLLAKLKHYTSLVTSYLKRYLSYLLALLLEILLLIGNIIRKGLAPLTPSTIVCLAKEQRRNVPLSNALLVLGSEVSKKHCRELWACGENTQLAVLVLLGGGMERFLWKELKEVVYSDQNWTRALYHLRHTLWPGGKLMEKSRHKLSEQERTELKKQAAKAIKLFLPNFFPPIVGAVEYDKAVIHCLDCLQNPRLNRHFFLRLVDLIFMKLVPELNDKTFQRELAKLRTLRQPRRNFGPRIRDSFRIST